MMELLRDPVWGFAALIVALLSIGLTVFLRKRKGMSYRFRRYPLVTVNRGLASRLRILFDGNPVEDVDMTIIVLENSGNVPIRKEDYDSPVQLRFGEGAQILSADVGTTEPADIEASVAIQDANWVEVKPVLLNKGDYIEIQVILTQFTKFSIRGRIEDVKQFTKSRERVLTPWRLLVPSTAVAVIAVVIFETVLLPPGTDIISLIAGIAIAVILFAGILRFTEWLISRDDPFISEEK